MTGWLQATVLLLAVYVAVFISPPRSLSSPSGSGRQDEGKPMSRWGVSASNQGHKKAGKGGGGGAKGPVRGAHPGPVRGGGHGQAGGHRSRLWRGQAGGNDKRLMLEDDVQGASKTLEQMPPYGFLALAVSWPYTMEPVFLHNAGRDNEIRRYPEHADPAEGVPVEVYSYWYKIRYSFNWQPAIQAANQEGIQFVPPVTPHFTRVTYPNDEFGEDYLPGWPPRRLVIHGLWPESSQAWRTNLIPAGYDTNEFRTANAIREEIMNSTVFFGPTLTRVLRRFMPQCSSITFGEQRIRHQRPWSPEAGFNFWKHVWYKHGTVVVRQQIQQNGPIQNEGNYFFVMLLKYSQFNLQNMIRDDGPIRPGSDYAIQFVEEQFLAHLRFEADRNQIQPGYPVESSHFFLVGYGLKTDVISKGPDVTAEESPLYTRSIYDWETGHPLHGADLNLQEIDPANQNTLNMEAFLGEVIICFDPQHLRTRPCMDGNREMGNQYNFHFTGHRINIP